MRNYEIRLTDGVVHCLYSGRMNIDITNEAIADAAAATGKLDNKWILFDFADADYREDYIVATI